MPRAHRSIARWEAEEGAPGPMGVQWIEDARAFNFALFSRHAMSVTLLLYAADDPVHPVLERRLDRLRNKTGRIWHCRVDEQDLGAAVHYAYRVDGPRRGGIGHRHDPHKILLDPYAPAVHFPPGYSRRACARRGATDGRAPLGILPPRAPRRVSNDGARVRHGHDAIVYELHVKGFTARASSGVAPERRGTFLGLVDKIPYLKDLGVTIVELLPVHQFDPQEGNYWGYMTLHFFSPHQSYAAGGDPQEEFRTMVAAFHQAGIEVWLDVVYNHTSEMDETGPTYSFRGIDNRSYYLLEPDMTTYVNDTGCGNTLRCGDAATRRLVLDSLRFWTEEMGVDGFRFDLASIFTRSADGSVDLRDPAIVAEISAYGCVQDLRLVAEAWDIASYQLGHSFPGFTWLQWNGRFRDDVRSFLRGDEGRVPDLMRRLYGSDDLFPDTAVETYRPWQSVNFVTAHDGFCLYDLVSYERKRNEANGHENRDGSDGNLSWNCGHEGDEGVSDEVMALRRRQVRNFFCLLMLANGTPMFCAGDEILNTQGGNNNPYNQDNETTWIDWELLERNRDVHRFFKCMIAFRKAHPSIARSRYWRDDVRWYGAGRHAEMGPQSRSIAYLLDGSSRGDDDLYVMINAGSAALEFAVQEGRAEEWLRVVDTSAASPGDIAEPGAEPALQSVTCRLEPRTVVVLRRPRSGS